MFISKIWNDGHYLTTLPSVMWDFATSDKLVTYTKPDPGTAESFF